MLHYLIVISLFSHFLYVPTPGLPASLSLSLLLNIHFFHIQAESLNSANGNDAPTILEEASHLPSSLMGNAGAQNASEAQSQTTSGLQQAQSQSQQILDDADVDVDPDVELDVEPDASLPPVSPLSVLSNLSANSPAAASGPGAASADKVKVKEKESTGAGEDPLLLYL